MTQDRQPGGTTTDFGAKRVAIEDKTRLVANVFSVAAPRYDLMNDLMSLGSHRLFKRFLLELSAIRIGQRVLDLACGSGDLSLLLADRLGPDGELLLADINADMLRLGRERLLNAGMTGARFLVADAESLPLADASLDLVVMAFGLRNLTRKELALAEIFRVLRAGGRLLVLEFSQPRGAVLGKAFSIYSSFWPLLGKLVAGDAAPYRYLVESIARHPPQEAVLTMFADAGFRSPVCHDLAGGILAIHLGIKPYSSAAGLASFRRGY